MLSLCAAVKRSKLCMILAQPIAAARATVGKTDHPSSGRTRVGKDFWLEVAQLRKYSKEM